MPAGQHDDQVVLAGLHGLAQPTGRGDVDRAPHLVQHDPMPRGQELGRPDPGEHVVVQRHVPSPGDGRHDPQGGVVQGRIPPHQERGGAAALRQHPLEGDHAGPVPVGDGGPVVGGIVPVAFGVGDLDQGEVERVADTATQREQVVVPTFAGRHRVVAALQRLGDLPGQMSGPHPDAEDPYPHSARSSRSPSTSR